MTSIGAWGDGGRTVTVGGNYTVTFQLSDAVEDEGIADDVWIKNVEVVDNSVVVTAQSISGHRLKCTMPDEWAWGSNEDKGEYNYVEWKHMEAAGAVCLPAAGYRDGGNGLSKVSHAGEGGYYWSASPDQNNYDHDLYFLKNKVFSHQSDYRSLAHAVRLVTECK